MHNQSLPVFWQNQQVGFIKDPKVDNFHLYGQWEAAPSQVATEFLEAVATITGGDDSVWVTCGIEPPEIRGTVEFLGREPSSGASSIEITIRI